MSDEASLSKRTLVIHFAGAGWTGKLAMSCTDCLLTRLFSRSRSYMTNSRVKAGSRSKRSINIVNRLTPFPWQRLQAVADQR